MGIKEIRNLRDLKDIVEGDPVVVYDFDFVGGEYVEYAGKRIFNERTPEGFLAIGFFDDPNTLIKVHYMHEPRRDIFIFDGERSAPIKKNSAQHEKYFILLTKHFGRGRL